MNIKWPMKKVSFEMKTHKKERNLSVRASEYSMRGIYRDHTAKKNLKREQKRNREKKLQMRIFSRMFDGVWHMHSNEILWKHVFFAWFNSKILSFCPNKHDLHEALLYSSQYLLEFNFQLEVCMRFLIYFLQNLFWHIFFQREKCSKCTWINSIEYFH